MICPPAQTKSCPGLVNPGQLILPYSAGCAGCFNRSAGPAVHPVGSSPLAEETQSQSDNGYGQDRQTDHTGQIAIQQNQSSIESDYGSGIKNHLSFLHNITSI